MPYLVKTNRASVKMVGPIVYDEVVILAIEGELPFVDAVGHTSNQGPKETSVVQIA